MAPKPQFFIIRPSQVHGKESSGGATYGRNIVPLIPADLFPKWVEIQGIPSQLSLEQTAGMTNLGSFAADEEMLSLRFHNVYQSGGSEERGNSTTVSGGSEGVGSSEKGGRVETPPPHTEGNRTAIPTLPVPGGLSSSRHNPNRDPSCLNTSSTATVANASNVSSQHHLSDSINIKKPAPSESSQGSQTSKIPPIRRYCQEWCHHGTCPRGRQCPRRHDMPQTRQGLAATGLTSFPQWYREISMRTPPGVRMEKKPLPLPSTPRQRSTSADRAGRGGAQDSPLQGEQTMGEPGSGSCYLWDEIGEATVVAEVASGESLLDL